MRQILFLALFMLALVSVGRGAPEEAEKGKLESLSPDRKFAFRYTAETETEGKSYVLINTQTGKTLARVAQADLDPGPSARFSMEVLWRPDSKAFALRATFWKRGSSVFVFLKDGAVFREAKLPELEAEITAKAKAGRPFPHVSEWNSHTPKRWLKDGSLLMEIETILDGDGATITSLRTVTLGFGKSAKATVLKSTTRISTDKS